MSGGNEMSIAFAVGRIGNKDVKRNPRTWRSVWWEVGRVAGWAGASQWRTQILISWCKFLKDKECKGLCIPSAWHRGWCRKCLKCLLNEEMNEMQSQEANPGRRGLISRFYHFLRMEGRSGSLSTWPMDTYHSSPWTPNPLPWRIFLIPQRVLSGLYCLSFLPTPWGIMGERKDYLVSIN